MSTAVLSAQVTLWPTSSSSDYDIVIRAVYKQVLGNAHIMESERLGNAESQLRNGRISVREFVREVAKSDQYKSRFFEASSQYRFIELNFKHLLGRAPLSQAEVSEHVKLYNSAGYDAEIDSYLDSDEYQEAFAEDTVPYYCGAVSQVGQKQIGYNRFSQLFRGVAESDKALKDSTLTYALATNSTSAVATGSPKGGTDKVFRIVVAGATGSRRRRSSVEYLVPAQHMSAQIQRINRTSGTIVSITEVV